ncbi:hypothetical protein HY411_03115 [Candidatus Gottesmanbacteria bacterium]|nr:hypothetical protein [Candidatus Gottesmanbacteria bacterium]
MTENGATNERGEKLSRDEALEIATRKLRERQVRVVEKLEPPIVAYKKEARISQLLGAHYEKLRAGLEEGSKTRAVVDGLERLVYDGAKVADVAVQGADIIIGGLLVGHGVRGAVTGVDRWNLFGRLNLSSGLAPGMARRFGPDAGTVLSRSHPVEPNRLWGVGKLLGGIGVLRYGPATMVARTALNMTL